jgi:glucokinase
LLEFNPDAGVFIGIELTGKEIRFGCFSLAYRLIKEYEHPLESTIPAVVIDTIVQGVRTILDQLELKKDQCLGVGIGSPGSVNPSSGTVLSPFVLKWKNPIQLEAVSKELDIPIFVENDINVQALGEVSTRSDVTGPVIYLSISTGVGAGIVIDGEIFHGAIGGAGELGHFSIDVNGKQCECGNRGCLELYVSGPAIAGKLHHIKSERENIFRILKDRVESESDKTAYDIYNELKEKVRVVITNLINLLNPSLVIIGGDIVRMGDTFMDDLRHSTRDSCGMVPFDPFASLCYGKLGREVGIYGAAVLADQMIFNPPRLPSSPANWS